MRNQRKTTHKSRPFDKTITIPASLSLNTPDLLHHWRMIGFFLDHFYSLSVCKLFPDATLYQLTQQLAQALQSKGLRLSPLPESCNAVAGWQNAAPNLPGSSVWFEGGIVS